MSLEDILKEVQNSYLFEKEVTIKGIKYKLKVLTLGEEKIANAVIDGLQVEDTDQYVKEVRIEILSRSISEIKGERIPDIVDTPDGKKDKSIYLKGFLIKLPDMLLQKLFSTYLDVKEQAEESIESEMQYDWFKTPEQRQKEYNEEREREESERKAEEKTAKKEEKSESDEDVEDIKLRKVNEAKEPEIPPESPNK